MGVRITGEEGVPRVFSNLAVNLIPLLFNQSPTLPLALADPEPKT